jgi:hypothetical protein
MTDKQPIIVVACKVFQGLIEYHLPVELKDQITFLDYGLHQVPKKLTEAVQETIDGIEEPSRILLGYGLCGNGLNGIEARQHTLIIPRADDCIAILLGSYQAYLAEFNDNPGTYYLTKGWLESGSDPLKQYHQTVEKYGLETGEWIMDQQYMHYKRLVLVAHTQEDLEIYRPRAKEVAKFCERWDTDANSNLFESNEHFILVPPGGVIQQSQFLRIPT